MGLQTPHVGEILPYDKGTGTGWKLDPNSKIPTYYENGKPNVRMPGAKGLNMLVQGAKSLRDSPLFQKFWEELNKSMEYIGEDQLQRGEISVEQGKLVKDTMSNVPGFVEGLYQPPDPSGDRIHPDCMHVFNEICTVNEYNKRYLKRIQEQTTDNYYEYVPGSGGID
jgi:hypothetical protein